MDEPQSTNRTAFLWVGAVMLVVIVATITAFAIVVFASDDSDGEASPTETADVATTVTGSLPLRSAPAGDTAITGQLEAGDEVTVIGRSADRAWLLVEVPGQPGLSGWLVTVAVSPPPDLTTLTVVVPEPEASSSATPSATATETAAQPTFTPDLPDLRIDSIFSRDNRVVIVVSNAGVLDVNAEIVVSIDGGEPHPADIKPGEPLRPDDQLEIYLDEEYVQRRALIRGTVTTNPEIEEDSLDNNTLETVIAPDVPNDLGIASAAFDGPEGSLRVVLVNNSTIPITGGGSVSVRGLDVTAGRLGDAQVQFELAPGETTTVDFPEIVELTIEEVTIRFSSNAVNDADSTNDVFPR